MIEVFNSWKQWRFEKIRRSICHALRRARRSVAKKTTMVKNNKKAKLPDLPPEIINEILSWLPLKPLVKSQLVCKEWQSLILSYRFMEKHMNRLPVHHCHNVSKPALHTTSTNFFCCIHVLDGLILLRSHISHKFILWNPAAHRVLELPNPLDPCNSLALSVLPATITYKIVSFFIDKKSSLLGCQVLTLGKALAWRQLTLKEAFIFPDILSVVSLGRVVHCAVAIKHGEEFIAVIITLDVETESLVVTRLPTGMFLDAQTVTALEWNGKMAICNIVGQDMELMVLEDYKKQRWCKEVIHLPFLEDEGFKRKTVQPLVGKEAGEVWFCLKDEYFKSEKIFGYRIGTRMTFDVESLASTTYNYKPSFVTFKGMQPDDELDDCRFEIELN